jgi:hypothetical protein
MSTEPRGGKTKRTPEGKFGYSIYILFDSISLVLLFIIFLLGCFDIFLLEFFCIFFFPIPFTAFFLLTFEFGLFFGQTVIPQLQSVAAGWPGWHEDKPGHVALRPEPHACLSSAA